MLSVAEALQRVRQQAQPLASFQLPIVEAVGMHLATGIVSDIDSPPYDKAMMDGYAVIASDLTGNATTLALLEEVTAGQTPTKQVTPGTATRIMTGAPIPDGADAVVMIEKTQTSEDGSKVLIDGTIHCSANILRKAFCLAQGTEVLASGTRIRAAEVGILAEVGQAAVAVIQTPKVAVLSTGDELVPPGETPGPGQIRNSNGPMLEAMAKQCGAQVISLGIGRDDRDDLEAKIQRGLQADVLILSGGVSAGVLDLVPSVLADNGVEKIFHKVHMKPGKPLWFGQRTVDQAQTLVFGLPGNPVSSLVCFHLFVRQAILRMQGDQADSHLMAGNTLAAEFSNKGDRPVFFPSHFDSSTRQVVPLDWKGSADLATLALANCFAWFEANREYQAGDPIEIVLM